MLLRFRISKKGLIIICSLLAVMIIFCSIKYICDRYIIFKAEQTYNILRSSYAETVKKANFKWTEKDMNTEVFARAFVKDLPVKKDCSYSTDDSCFPIKINFQRPLENLHIINVLISDYYKVELNNNVGIAFKILSPTCNHVRDRCGTVFIDINGSKHGPNKFGEDLYDFGIYKTELKTYLMEANHIHRCINGTGQGCAEYMFTYKNRNYKKYLKMVKK